MPRATSASSVPSLTLEPSLNFQTPDQIWPEVRSTHTFTLRAWSKSISIYNTVLGILPKHLFFTMFWNTDLSRSANTNPYILQHFKLNYFVMYVNEWQVCYEGLTLITAHSNRFLAVSEYVTPTQYPDHTRPLHETLVHVNLWLAHGWERLEQPHQSAHQKISAYNLNFIPLYLRCYYLSSEWSSLIYSIRFALGMGMRCVPQNLDM